LLKEAWTLAIETLSWIQMQRLSERSALAKTMKQIGIYDPNAARLAHRIVTETTRRQNFIDAHINKTIKPSSLDEFTLGIQAFLRLYVYQTRLAKNQARVDVEEAANIAKLGRSILGWKTMRQVESFLGFLLTQKPQSVFEGVSDEERIALSTFHPAWYVKYCFKLFGRTETIRMLESDVQQPPTYIRLNTLKVDESKILEKLAEEGTQVEKVDGLKHVYRVLSLKHPLTKTTSFNEGLFYIQDKASCYAAEAANPQPNTNVMDVCAAPGAKTSFLAQLMQNRGTIYSIDFSKRRMNLWKNEISRMSVKIAEPLIADARVSLPLTSEADLVVLDPPCTSTGTFRKSPSDKWRLTPNSISNMADVQWRMINNCAENVKPKGTLIYSTCSITVEENELIIERFLKWHSEFTLAEATPDLGMPGLRGLDRCRRLYPHVHQCNGFFIAKLSKT
jgi:16S rRNA (cytosine967-C5)-methyltransferase